MERFFTGMTDGVFATRAELFLSPDTRKAAVGVITWVWPIYLECELIFPGSGGSFWVCGPV